MKRTNPLISIIVPVYNKEAYLRECVDSILEQTYRRTEVILVDDESTDKSGRICDEFGQADGRVRVIHQKNGGPTAACVAGMEAASGGYYMFVDSDDYLEPETLAEMADRLAGVPGEIVCCDHLVEKQRGTERVKNGVAPGIYEGEQLREQIKARLIGEEKKVIPLSRCMKLCEKSLFAGNEAYYDYSLRFGDDTNLMYPALLESSRVVIMKDAFYYHYRYVEDSLVHGYDEGLSAGVDRLMAAVKRTAEEKKAPDAAAAVAREHCYMLLYVMKNELRAPGKDYRKRIQTIFGEEKVRAMVQNTPIAVTERSNQLLYLGMTYPGGVLLRVLRLILRVYDRK
ncbi:MAG: glycosyltransferase family 2 protein [Lachnospiraceae bacterium]|nr:glycosyltransferase family 2 protein [Lachnospiraceae bacterium]